MNLNKILCTLSGDDYSIIRKCDRNTQNRFTAIGGIVTIIFAICFSSSYLTFTKLFQNDFIGIFLAVIFSWMITNIYLLILYTLSKNSFPDISKGKGQAVSIALRIVFICFIAIIVSKPIETLVFSMPLENELISFKQEQIAKYTLSTTQYFNVETKNLKLIIEKQTKSYGNSITGQVGNYEALLARKEFQKNELIAAMIRLVNGSNYFIKSITILNNKYKSCWLITFLTMFIFLIPVYIKKIMREHSDYCIQKSNIENKLVKEEYSSFKKKYNRIFQECFNENIHFSESYVDPPFNTIRKKDERKYLKEDDLIADLYNV